MTEEHEAETRKLREHNGDLSLSFEAETRRRQQLQKAVETLEIERDTAKESWKIEIARNKATKEMLIVTGKFKGESIETAAKAISERERVREAVADIYRAGEEGEAGG